MEVTELPSAEDCPADCIPIDNTDNPEQISIDDTRCITVPVPFCARSPDYECCAPTAMSVLVEDDSHYMPFVPFADDPSFDFKSHVEQYKYIAWEHRDFSDVDMETVVYDAACALHTEHGLSFEDIDKTGLFPLTLLNSDKSFGLLTRMSKRDYPRKAALPKTPSVKSQPHTEEECSPRRNARDWNKTEPELTAMISTFCHRLSCAVSYCTKHDLNRDRQRPSMPLPVTPTLKSTDFYKQVSTPCGETCFLILSPEQVSDFYHSQQLWSQNDLDILEATLRFTPDATPCDLAVICDKPCTEAFSKRSEMIPNSAVFNRKGRSARYKRNTGRPLVLSNQPCQHKGACHSRDSCTCVKNGVSCVWACRCDQSCLRRWPGCRCTRTNTQSTCRTMKCACFRTGRECDPLVCCKCNTNACDNLGLGGTKKGTNVQKAQWGFGLFITETANTNDFIMEYVGELIANPTARSRHDLATHRQRNYLYKLDSTLNIDATYMGNESKYINHDKNPNCVATKKIVDGEPRIGIYAKRRIEAGEELTLDYGPDFFAD
ncbi:SET domain-containing protein, partial [Dendrothele bispora CBS 962.96]